jgi:hypothetical protein
MGLKKIVLVTSNAKLKILITLKEKLNFNLKLL